MQKVFSRINIDPVRSKTPWASGRKIFGASNGVDWPLLVAIIPLLLAGLITMKSLGGGADYFFNRQIIWIGFGLFIFFLASLLDWHILRNGWVLLAFYVLGILVLLGLLLVEPLRGARAWIRLGLFSVEPAEPMKLILVLVLAKYFSRRHVEIAHFRHIIVSGIYAAIPAFLVFIQPDLGSAIIFTAIWLGMILVSGVSKKHLLIVVASAFMIALVLWFFVLAPYQQARVLTFLDPLRDPKGAGYNAIQSVIAVGSGGLFGKGVGYGTQSRLEFLPEHETDFIFAAFGEEWGFVGITVLFLLFGAVFWRILKASFSGASNFERLFGIGLVFFILSHFIIHVGMNLGLLPVTGISLSFLSYGGSHMLVLFAGLGMLMGMRRYGSESGGSRPEEDFALADVIKV
jgi:rod shape determining protein RodA